MNKLLAPLAILALLLTASTLPAATTPHQPPSTTATTGTATCYYAGTSTTTTLTLDQAHHLQKLISLLANATANDPQSDETQAIQQQILSNAEAYGLLPKGMTAATIHTQIERYGRQLAATKPQTTGLILPQRDHEFFCNLVATGSVGLVPIIILPRYIPILMLPVPRLGIGWSTQLGAASVGGLISHTGFMAEGQQRGFALGFWGIGLSIFLPPVCFYALFGYAVYTYVAAKYIQQWNPNTPPEISPTYPPDGATQVPLNTTELSFSLIDWDNDRMSYSVTTSPDIGGGNGMDLKDGTYSVNITGLQPATLYHWTVQATDGKDTTNETYSFTTGS